MQYSKKAMIAVCLVSAILLSGCGSNSSELQAELDSANSRITELEAEVAQKKSEISNLNTKIEAMTPAQTEASPNAEQSNSAQPDENNEQLASTNTIMFSGLQIEFTQDMKVETVDNQYSEYNGMKAIGVPVTITNVSDETNYLNMFYLKIFGSAGVETDDLNTYFDDGNLIYNKLRPGASVDGYIYIPYDGNGDYYVSFDNIINDPIDQLIHIEIE